MFDVCIKAVCFLLYNLASVFLDLKSIGCVSFVKGKTWLGGCEARRSLCSRMSDIAWTSDASGCLSPSFDGRRVTGYAPQSSRSLLRLQKKCALNQRPSSTTRLAHGASKVSDAAYELRARTSSMSNEQRSAGPFAGTTPRITVRGDTRLLGERSLLSPSGQAPIKRSVLSGLGRKKQSA